VELMIALRRFLVVVLACFGLLASSVPEALAQAPANYSVLPRPSGSAKDDRIATRKCCDSGSLTNQAAVNRYLGNLLADLTDPREFPNAAKRRQELKYQLLRRAGLADDKSTSRYLQERLLEQLPQMLSTAYHPFARVNAALVLGDLNDVEAPSSGKEPPVPSAAAQRALLKELQVATQPDGVRAALLVGLDRACRFGVRDPDWKPQAVRQLLELAQLSHQNQDGPVWLRRQALQALGHLGFAGDQGEVASLFVKTLSDSQERLDIRSEAARALGFLQLQNIPPGKLPPLQTARALASLAVDAHAQIAPAADPRKQHALQRHLSDIELAFQGPDLTMYRRGVDGDFRGDRGLSHSSVPVDQQSAVAEIQVRVQELVRAAFEPSYNRDAVEARVEELQQWLNRNPPAGGAVVPPGIARPIT